MDPARAGGECISVSNSYAHSSRDSIQIEHDIAPVSDPLLATQVEDSRRGTPRLTFIVSHGDGVL